MRTLSTIAALLVLASTAGGTTWNVERDGSGDFDVIQDAIDSAAPGDSIQIGPGRFDDFTLHNYEDGTTGATIMAPRLGPLVIRGAGMDATILGPETLTSLYMGHLTGIFVPERPQPFVVLEDLTLENAYWPLWLTGSFTARRLRINSGGGGNVIMNDAPSCLFVDCEFLGAEPFSGIQHISMFLGGDNDSLKVVGSTFRWGKGILAEGIEGLVVKKCRFDDVLRPIAVSASDGLIEDCRISYSQTNDSQGINLSGSIINLENCRVDPGASETIRLDSGTQLTATQCVFGAAQINTISVRESSTAQVNNCDIVNGGVLAVEVQTSVSVAPTMDFTSCYWGSTDSTQISDWILDGYDYTGPGLPRSVVEFLPLRESSVPLQRTGISSIKALFGSGQ